MHIVRGSNNTLELIGFGLGYIVNSVNAPVGELEGIASSSVSLDEFDDTHVNQKFVPVAPPGITSVIKKREELVPKEISLPGTKSI
jgi:hypothetical protein